MPPTATVLDDLCAVIGYTATRTVALWWAGRELYVPRHPRPDHALAALIGMPALRALVREWPGERIDIPGLNGDDELRRARDIALRLVQGQDTGTIAQALGLTQRRVEQIRRGLVEAGWLAVPTGRPARGVRYGPVSDPTSPG